MPLSPRPHPRSAYCSPEATLRIMARDALKSPNSASPAHPVLTVNVQCGVTASNAAPSQWSKMTDPSPAISSVLTASPPLVPLQLDFSMLLLLCLPLFFLFSVPPYPKLEPSDQTNDRYAHVRPPTLSPLDPQQNHFVDFVLSIVSWRHN